MPRNNHTVQTFFAQLGPGLITGAADDDPSGIATYSVTGAGFGYGPLWTALFCFPLMAAVQLMCSRLGMVSGRGLAAVVRKRYSRWVLWGACLLLIVANVINIAADLGGMAEATEMVTGIPSEWMTPVFAAVIVAALLWTSYRFLARIFKWLTLVLFAYVITAFLAQPDWGEVLRATFVPDIQWSSEYLSVLVAILGTSISPYLFFWQAAQEVEEERADGRKTVAERQGATDEELRRARTDVMTGMFFSNFVMYFIILTTAATLHAHGITKITTAQPGGGSAEAPRRKGRLLAVQSRTDRHRHAGRTGAGGVERLRDFGSDGVARIARSQAQAGAEILRRAGRRHVIGRSIGLFGPGRGEDALLVRGGQWRPRAAADRTGGAVDFRPLRHG